MAVDFNIEIRKKQLDSLDQFVTSSRNKVNSILESLGWSVDKIQEEQRLFVNCPHDGGHKVPAEKIEDHIENCKLRSAGYDLQEEFISEPVVHSEDSNIKIGTEKKIEILCQAYSQKPFFQTAWNGKDPDPLTYSRLYSTFSTDERLVLYDYCIANTRGPPELPEFDTSIVMNEKNDSSFTKEDLLSFERDIKRRSVKYKPIHTNHKNYKEVLREVIDSQMEQYNDWLGRVNGTKKSYRENIEEADDEAEGPEKHQEDVERPFSSVSKFSDSSKGSAGKRHTRISKTLHSDSHSDYDKSYDDSNSQYKGDSSKSKYKHHDEDSQESNTYSKVSSVDLDSSCENFEKARSIDSSIHSSYRYKEKRERYKESRRRRRSRSDSREKRKRDHSSGSSRHSSKSHRYKFDKYRRRNSRERKRTH